MQSHYTKLRSDQTGEDFVVFSSGWCPLSTFNVTPFFVEGVRYATANHYYQCKKSLFFGDNEAAEAILETSSPSEVERIAATIRGFDQSKWDEVSEKIMYEANLRKFKSSFSARRVLKDTGNGTIVFASPRATYWGNGIGHMHNEKHVDKNEWLGNNKLGEILMKLREEFNMV